MRAAVQHPDLGPRWHVTWIVSHTTDRDTIAADGKCLEGLEWATEYCRQAGAGRNAAAAGFGSGRPEYRNRFQVRAIATAWPARKRAFAARRPMIALPRGPRGGFLETLALGGWRAAAFVLLGLALLAPAAPAEARDTTPRVLVFLLLGLQSAHGVIFHTLREAQVFIES